MTSFPVRVMVQDAWDEVAFSVPPTTRLADLKQRALDVTRIRRPADEYVLKFRGAELMDESQSLTEAGVAPNGALIVLPRHRRPVR